MDSPHPEAYESNIPVHQDGSCNGLQHYAALGLDEKGGAQVNLVPQEKPGDVYTAVLKIVKKHIHDDLNSSDTLIRDMATLLRGGEEVTRKVVKQTVMTSVYGVTFVGAREQIEGQLSVGEDRWREEQARRDDKKMDFDDDMLYSLSMYLARLTLGSIGVTNKGATTIMAWLNKIAAIVGMEEDCDADRTHQQSRVLDDAARSAGRTAVSSRERVPHLHSHAGCAGEGRQVGERREFDCSDVLPVLTRRQSSAFPPNFVREWRRM